MVRSTRLNDEDRRQWINNDEGLYNWWRNSRQSMRAFIRANRSELDAQILPTITGEKPAHRLTYHHGPGCPCYSCTKAVSRG